MITTADSLNTNINWESSLQVTSQTGANQESTTVKYDTSDRPSTVNTPYGAQIQYSYSTSAPQIVKSISSRWTKTYLDGLGRVSKVQQGSGNNLLSETDSVYEAVGATPLGKVTQRSMPFASGGTPKWRVSTFDSLGRILTRKRPDGASTYTYSYAGNSIKVTDPAGKWKQFTQDAFGHIATVTEPSPNTATEPNHLTQYSYDVFGHLMQVRMDRTIGGTVRTQYRTWVYDPTTLRLTSKTSPESGTVTYTYNTDGTLATVTDAKNQRRVYTYDNYGRITQIARGTMSGTTFTENLTQRTNYTYSGTNGGYSTATAGRVSSITYKGPHGLAFNEMYSYQAPGGISKKLLSMTGTPFGSSTVNLEADYSFDAEGNIQTIQYPNSEIDSNNAIASGPLFTYEYDSMERLNKLSDKATLWVSSVTYGPANEMQQMVTPTFTETRNYNANLELVELTSGANLHYKYNYSATQDNGQIQSQQDIVSGETISYQYDTLKRLTQASATGDPHGAWSQAMSYDGFGNLTQKASSNAPGLSIAVDYTTNHIQTNAAYDSNGNMTGYAGAVYGYDIDNRLVSANNSVAYGYDSTNQRVYKAAVSGTTYSAEEIYFYGTDGHKYGTWQINPSSGVLLKASVTKQWFGNRLVSPQDGIDSRGRYFVNGEERINVTPPNPPNDQEKFASYTRDSATTLDYANQRYYSSIVGRFMQPDPYEGSEDLNTPQSWNRFSYVLNDPENSIDPTGLVDYAQLGKGVLQVGLGIGGIGTAIGFTAGTGGFGSVVVAGIGIASAGNLVAGTLNIINRFRDTPGTLQDLAANADATRLSNVMTLPGAVTMAVTGGNYQATQLASTAAGATLGIYNLSNATTLWQQTTATVAISNSAVNFSTATSQLSPATTLIAPDFGGSTTVTAQQELVPTSSAPLPDQLTIAGGGGNDVLEGLHPDQPFEVN